MQVKATAATALDKAHRQQQTDGVRMNVDIAKHKSTLDHQRRQNAMQAIQAAKQKQQTPSKGD